MSMFKSISSSWLKKKQITDHSSKLLKNQPIVLKTGKERGGN